MSKNNRKGAEAVATTETPKKETTLVVVHNANEETATAETSETINQPTETREVQPKSIKDILDKSFKIQKHIQNLQNLDEAAKELDSFNLGTSKIKDTLTIRDGRGNEFETTNLFLIDSTVTFLKGQISEKTREIETELQLAEAA